MMNYPMKKRVWINNERLDIWEQANDEVTTPWSVNCISKRWQ